MTFGRAHHRYQHEHFLSADASLMYGGGLAVISRIGGFDASALMLFARSPCRCRRESLLKARSLHSSGNTAAAYEFYQKAVDISPATARQFIKASTSYNS